MARSSLRLLLSACLCAIVLGCMPATVRYQPVAPTRLTGNDSSMFNVAAPASWLDTGIQVTQGETYSVTSSGVWQASPFCPQTGAEGLAVENLFCMKGIFASSFPLPGAPVGALVGKIGPNGKVFLIGDTPGFIANASGSLHLMMNDPEGLLGDNIGELAVRIALHGANPGAVGGTRTAGTAAAKRPSASGFYSAEQDITFNVLETVSFDSTTGALRLAGRFDPRYAGPRIPYLQHLAVFLENPSPRISLDWKPGFERRVDQFFREMDDVRNMEDLIGSGRLVDDNGRITQKGRLFLPMFGVKAFKHGNAAGALGVQTRLKELGLVTVTQVTRGSAADRAGVQVGDDIGIMMVDEFPYQPYVPSQLTRDVRYAGAGAEATLSIIRGSKRMALPVTLDAYKGDSWEHVTKYDINASIFSSGGYNDIANVLKALDQVQRHQNDEAGVQMMWALVYIIDIGDWAVRERERMLNGEISKESYMNELPRRMIQGMETKMGFPQGSLMRPYESYRRRTGDAWAAQDHAVLEMNRLLQPKLKDALRKALHKNDEITLPVATLTGDSSIQPRVVPRYIDIPPESELARLFVEADYVGKMIIHKPELAKRIPAYKSEYAFSAVHPGRVEETTNRLWIEPGRMEVHRSADNATLRFGEARMRINIGRAIGGGTERRDTAYGDFLTGLYDDLAGEFPQLHELREASKMAVVARWIAAQDPAFRLPREGRSEGPLAGEMEGFLTLIWSPKRIKVSLIAPGGIDFNVPPIGPSGPVFPDAGGVNVPVDASIVDLRDAAETDYPPIDPQTFARFTPDLPARYRRPLTEPPVPSSVRLVGLAKKGRTTLGEIHAMMVQTRSVSDRCNTDASRRLRDHLNDAALTAQRLQSTEQAINALTSPLPERQRAFEAINKVLEEQPRRIRDAAVNLFTAGLLNVYDDLEGSVDARSIQDFEMLISNMNEASEHLDDISGKLSNYDLAFRTATAGTLEEREAATKDLLLFLKDTLGDASKLKGRGQITRAFRTAGKTIKFVDAMVAALEQADGIYKLAKAVEAHSRLTKQSDEELQALRDKLLPLQRTLSRQLDEKMKATVIQDYDADPAAFACGATS